MPSFAHARDINGGYVMASWEDIKTRLSDTGDRIVEKIRVSAESARLSGELRDMEKDRDKNYAMLGQMFYEDKYGRMKIKTLEKKIAELDDNNPKKAIVLKVLELKQGEVAFAELAELKKKLKGITKCPNCGGDVSPDEEFCVTCGTRIVRDGDEEPVSDEEDEGVNMEEEESCEEETAADAPEDNTEEETEDKT